MLAPRNVLGGLAALAAALATVFATTAVSLPLPTPTPALDTPPPVLQPSVLAPTAVPALPVETAPTAAGGSAAGALPVGPLASPGSGQAQPYPGPSPDEQQSLPPEQGRADLEQQQWDMQQATDQMDAEFADAFMLDHHGDGKFDWPVEFRSHHPAITQPFGCTTLAGEPYNPMCASKRWHTGLDLGIPSGTPVFAAGDGVAHVYRGNQGYGNYVLLNHGDGWYTLYGHLEDFAIQDHQVVKKGQLIGFSGSSGFSTGPHLHFEIRHETDYLDPCAFLKNC